jgi:hypothetical protein
MKNILLRIKNYKLYKNRKMNIAKIIDKGTTIAEMTRLLKDKKFKFKVGPLNSGSGCVAGEEVTIVSCGGSLQAPYYGIYTARSKGRVINVYGCELEFSPITISDLEEKNTSIKGKIEELKRELVANTSKISFMKENGLEQLENATLTKVDKAKAIAKLIKG